MRKELYWPVGIAVFLILFVGCLIGFFIFSQSLPLNLVNQNYYKDGLNYQERIERLKRTRDLNETLQWNYRADKQIVELVFPKNLYDQLSKGKITFFRPSDAALDVSFALTPDINGRQVVNVQPLRQGHWRVFISWTAGQEGYYQEKTLLKI